MPDRSSIDTFSFELGRTAQGLAALTELFSQHSQIFKDHCEEDDKRHVENVKLLKENNEAIKRLTDVLEPIAASHALTKRRIAALMSTAFILLGVVGWAAESVVKWGIEWVLRVKFGGP